jgi:ATP-dependent Lon protease
MEYEQRQQLLEADCLSNRFQTLYKILENEVEISAIRSELQQKVKDKVEANQKKYVLREQMQTIREELGEDSLDSEIEEYKQKTDKLKAPKEVKEKPIINPLEKFSAKELVEELRRRNYEVICEKTVVESL